MSLSFVIPVVLAVFMISAFLARRFCNPRSLAYILDHPNDRSLHDRPVPRSGGLAVLMALIAGSAVTTLFYPVPGLAGAAASLLIVAAVSFADDRRSVSPVIRFAAHVVASAIIVHSGYLLERMDIPGASWEWPHAVSTVFSILYVVWMINLYNFMDGMDGFAGGMAVAGFGFFSALGWMAGHESFFVINLVIVAAAAGFLIFNFPPARIFMGDVGSSVLGLLAAMQSLWGVRDGIFPFWTAILVFSPFILDATITLIRRMIRGEAVWKAHKTHYYQKLAQTGWGHRKTVLLEYAIMLGCGLTALLTVRGAAALQVVVLAGWGFFYAVFFTWVSRYATGRRRRAA